MMDVCSRRRCEGETVAKAGQTPLIMIERTEQRVSQAQSKAWRSRSFWPIRGGRGKKRLNQSRMDRCGALPISNTTKLPPPNKQEGQIRRSIHYLRSPSQHACDGERGPLKGSCHKPSPPSLSLNNTFPHRLEVPSRDRAKTTGVGQRSACSRCSSGTNSRCSAKKHHGRAKEARAGECRWEKG